MIFFEKLIRRGNTRRTTPGVMLRSDLQGGSAPMHRTFFYDFFFFSVKRLLFCHFNNLGFTIGPLSHLVLPPLSLLALTITHKQIFYGARKWSNLIIHKTNRVIMMEINVREYLTWHYNSVVLTVHFLTWFASSLSLSLCWLHPALSCAVNQTEYNKRQEDGENPNQLIILF